MPANPSVKKRERERKLQERQRAKAAKREQRKLDRIAGVTPTETALGEPLVEPETSPPRDG
jgi:hypothetical protein